MLSYPCCGAVSECVLLLRDSVPSSEELEESKIKPPSSGRPGNRNLHLYQKYLKNNNILKVIRNIKYAVVSENVKRNRIPHYYI